MGMGMHEMKARLRQKTKSILVYIENFSERDFTFTAEIIAHPC